MFHIFIMHYYHFILCIQTWCTWLSLKGGFIMTSELPYWYLWYFWIEQVHSYPVIPNKHISLYFALLCDREQPVWLNAVYSHSTSGQTAPTELAGATFTFWIISWQVTNWDGVCSNFFVKDVAMINCDNVQLIFSKILIHVYVRTRFFWDTRYINQYIANN